MSISHEPPLGAPLKLLVIDDDEVDRMALRRTLRAISEDLAVVEVDRADLGFARLAEERFDCVLCDLRMPGHDGRWLLEQVRGRGSDVPVIMLTGHGDEETAVEVLKLGAADYIPKFALATERLSRSLRSVIRVHRAEREARAAQAALHHHAKRLRGLANLAPELDVTMDIDQMLRRVAKQGRELLDATHFKVRVAAAGAGDEEASATMGAGGIPASLAVPLDVRAPTRDVIDGLVRVAAPISDRTGEVVGTVCALRALERPFDESEVALLAQLAQLTAVSISNRRYFSQALAAASAREETLAVASHDLRNPLTVVRLALQATPTPAALTRARNAVERMDGLIRDLLDIAKIDNGQFAVEPLPQSPADLVNESVELMQPLAAHKRLEIRAQISAGLPTVTVDRGRIAQVFQNIIANAIRFSETGVIEVSADDSRGLVRFAISDNGPGIPNDELTRIFDRFWRRRTADREGAGLGLAIAKGIVEAHGGSIWAYNRPNGGATFYFTVPTLRVEGDAHAAA